MTGAVECVLVEKAAVQKLREEATADRESGNPVQIMKGRRRAAAGTDAGIRECVQPERERSVSSGCGGLI